MVDEWPSRLHDPHLPTSYEERQGVAALSPEYDQTVPTSSRRSAPPIGSLSPQGHVFGAPAQLSSDKHEAFQNHAVLTPNPQQQPPPPPQLPTNPTAQRQPVLSPPVSASVAAADFLAECTHSADFHSVGVQGPPFPAAEQPHHSLDFDLFGLANLDLGPPVFEPQPRSAPVQALSSPRMPHQLQDPHMPTQDISIDHFQSPHNDLNLDSSPTLRPMSGQTPAHTITAPSISPSRTPRELAHPTRCVLLRNIPPGIDDDDIRKLLQAHGPLRDLGAQQRSRGGRGSVLATYYDLRHARAAVRALDSSVHFGRRLEARFQCPAETQMATPPGPTSTATSGSNSGSPSANQGTLVVFNLDTSTSAEDIRALFSTIGDVKEIRATPNKKHHKFVEFYDVRDAERAMQALNKTEVAGKRIKIEISRPGGRAGNLSRQVSAPAKLHSNGAGAQHQQARHQPGPAHVIYSQDIAGHRTSPRHQSQASQSHESLTAAHLPGQLLSSINQGVQASSSFPQSSPDVSFDGRPTAGANLSGLVTPSGFDATNALSGFDRQFGNGHLNADLAFSTTHGTFESIPDSRHLHPSAEARHPDMHSLYSNHAGQLPRYANSSAQPGITKPAPDSYIQALYNSPDSDEGRGPTSAAMEKSPRRGQFHTAKGDVPRVDGGSAGLYRGAFADAVTSGTDLHGRIDHGGPSAQQRKIGAGSGSTIGDRSFSHKQVTIKTNSHAGAGAGGGHKPYNQQQNNSKYALDIRKVRSGEETRTALMIRNIPNKYNQKMLLSTLEEGHKGHFDFIYLPIDFKNKCNVGYAFINFTKPQYIEPFYDAFHGKKWGRFNSEKVCEITFARIQGRQQLIAHFQNSSLLLEDPKCRPVIFDSKGRQEEFPIGSHVRTRRGPSSRDSSHRSCETTPPYSPTKHRGRS